MLFPKLGGRLFGGRARPPLFRLSVDRFAPGALVSALGGTFTRASTATYRDQNGVIQTAASGVARDNHYELDPVSNTYVRTLLLEGSRSNLLTFSEDLTNATWGNAGSVVTITPNQAISPDSNLSADLVDLSASATSRISNAATGTANTSTYTASIWLRAESGGGTWPLAVWNGSSAIFSVVELTTDWQRFTITFNGTGASNVAIYAGNRNGAPAHTLTRVLAWGAQLELGSFASSYIPTTSAAVTRQADVLTVPYTATPQNQSIYARFIDKGTSAGIGSRLMGIAYSGADHFSVWGSAGTLKVNLVTSSPSQNLQASTPAIASGQIVELASVLTKSDIYAITSINGSASTESSHVAGSLPASWSTNTLQVATGGGVFHALRDMVVVKGTKSLGYFRALITDDLASYDADAKALVKRAVSSGATLVGPSGTDHRSFLNSFISALKNGGSAGDCYSLIDAMYLPILSIRDSANKVSKLLDGAKQKGTGFGTGGYYDASQTTASLQQTLTRGDNKGNLVKYSGDATNAIWVKGAVTTATGSNTPSGKASVRVAGDATIVSHQVYQQLTFTQDRGYTFEFLVKSQPCQFVQILAGSGQFGTQAFANFDIVNGTIGTKGTNCTSAIQNAGNGWWRVSMTATATASGTNSANLAFVTSASASRAQTMDGTGVALDVSESSFRESTWDSDYIATTSAPAYAGLDGKPVLMFDASTGSNAGYSTVGTLESKPQPATVFGVVRKDGGGSTFRMWFDSKSGSNRHAVGFNNDTTSLVTSAGVSLFAATDQAEWGQYSVRFNGSGSAIRRKGAQIAAGNAGTQAMATGIIVGNDFSPAFPHNGPLAAVLLVRSPLTAAQLAHIEKTIADHFPSIAPTIPAPSLVPVTDESGQNITDHSGNTITN